MTKLISETGLVEGIVADNKGAAADAAVEFASLAHDRWTVTQIHDIEAEADGTYSVLYERVNVPTSDALYAQPYVPVNCSVCGSLTDTTDATYINFRESTVTDWLVACKPECSDQIFNEQAVRFEEKS